MKRLKVGSIVVMAMALMLFTSCRDRIEKGVGFGVVQSTSGKMTLNTVSYSFGNFLGPLYSPTIEDQLVENDCYTYGYEINYDDKNAVQRQYTVAAITDLKQIPRSDIRESYSNRDFFRPNANSLAINNAAIMTYINNQLFVATNSVRFDKQEVAFQMYYDLDSTEVKDEITIYNLYVVGEKTNSVTTTTQTSKQDYSAFTIKPFMDRAAEREEVKGNDYLGIRLCYINSIDKDKGTFSHIVSDQIIMIYVGNRE